jgi:hypothetical protein
MIVNVPRQFISGSTPMLVKIFGEGARGADAPASPAAAVAVSINPPVNGRIVRPFITSLRFMSVSFC